MSDSGAVPLITFLSDYGPWDEFVGVCHAVIARRCPRARVIDLGHGIARHDIRAGALALHAALRYCAPGVHLAVVDPGVGGARRAVAARVEEHGRILVGPDNGLLAVAAGSFGGVVEAVDIGDSPECLRPISATFHGRDVFAPVAAALADGASLENVGEPIAVGSLETLVLPRAHRHDGALIAHVLTTDVFGNVSLDATPELAAAAGLDLGAAFVVRIGGSRSTSEQSSACPAGATQRRPWRPRPSRCSRALTSVPCGAPASASARASALVEPVVRRWTRGVPSVIAGAASARRREPARARPRQSRR